MSQTRSNFRSPIAWLFFLVPFALGLTADLVSKHLAFKYMAIEVQEMQGGLFQVLSNQRDNTVLIPHIANLKLTVNQGAVFGIGQGQRWIFVVASVVAMGVLTYLFLQSGQSRLQQIILGMLLAGVIGNLVDRAMFGYVRDMIFGLPTLEWSDLRDSWPQEHVFPWIFNVADILLCVGVALVLLMSFLPEKKPSTEAAAEPTAAAS